MSFSDIPNRFEFVDDNGIKFLVEKDVDHPGIVVWLYRWHERPKVFRRVRMVRLVSKDSGPCELELYYAKSLKS
jgi:hypothetical protein